MENIKKVSKFQILTILILIVVFVLLFPIPMSRSRQELYITTETVSIPHQVFKSMQWQVTWYTLTIDKEWGASIGTQVFASSFGVSWGSGVVYGGYDDGVGFQATASFFLEAAGMYTFTLGSDDGSRLYVDDELVIDSWYDHTYREVTQRWYLSDGWHALTIWYYEWRTSASIYFNVDKGDLFIWEETQYQTVEIPIISNRTVTETVYLNILEYLMKGGTG